MRDNTAMILTETPANPTMKCSDIAAISEIAQKAGAVHAVDNTFLTPYYQRPLELGADISFHSTTKYMDGHNATVGGAVVSNSQEHADAVRFIQNSTGTIMSPQVAWLTLQGCKTLSIRMDAQSASAMAIAEFLEDNDLVRRVCYPGLRSHPGHGLARRQQKSFGAMISFELDAPQDEIPVFLEALQLFTLAESLGGSLDVSSVPGQGSVFTTTVPLEEIPADDLDAAETLDHAEHPTVRVAPGRTVCSVTTA